MRIAITLALATVMSGPLAALEVGDPAPLFTLPDQDGEPVSLTDNYGRWTVLSFYPADATSGCTLEMNDISANLAALRALGAEIYGLSTQGVESKKAFCEKEGLLQTMLSDVEQRVSADYGVLIADRGIANRVTFYVSPAGLVSHIDRAVNVQTHGADVIATLGELQAASAAAALPTAAEPIAFGGRDWRLPAAFGAPESALAEAVQLELQVGPRLLDRQWPPQAVFMTLDGTVFVRTQARTDEEFATSLHWDAGEHSYAIRLSGPPAAADALRNALAAAVVRPPVAARPQ